MTAGVFVVDDDPGVRDSLTLLLKSAGYEAEAFASAAQFLAGSKPGEEGCLIVDVRMPEMDGLALQKKLKSLDSPLQVIVITGHAEIHLAVEAMKEGAVDFLEKPFAEEVLLDSVRQALERARQNGSHVKTARVTAARLALLTERERQVLDLIVAGKANKVIAHELSISPRTVEIHRARVMEKMGAGNLASLVRMALTTVA